jgi:hypothetical protein
MPILRVAVVFDFSKVLRIYRSRAVFPLASFPPNRRHGLSPRRIPGAMPPSLSPYRPSGTGICRGQGQSLWRCVPVPLQIEHEILRLEVEKFHAVCQVEHTRHRSDSNFAVNLMAGIVAYSLSEDKPTLSLFRVNALVKAYSQNPVYDWMPIKIANCQVSGRSISKTQCSPVCQTPLEPSGLGVHGG